jgi:DHA1 family purine ribonucleoside efflux pump-like MFS transporter
MSASLTMRLVPARTVPKALSVIFGAVSIALVIAAPLGSFLGGIIGWRNVFNGCRGDGPAVHLSGSGKRCRRLPGEPAHHKQNMFSLLKRHGRAGGDDRHLYGLCRSVRLLHLYPPGLHHPGRALTWMA